MKDFNDVPSAYAYLLSVSLVDGLGLGVWGGKSGSGMPKPLGFGVCSELLERAGGADR